MRIYIYGLVDPRSEVLRYVGKSVAPSKRLDVHIQKAKTGCETHCRRWIAELLRLGRYPILKILEECAGQTAANAAEKRHIAEYRSRGIELTNLTVGGDGRAAGSKLRPETRARMSAARKGKPIPQHVIDAATRAKIGKPRPRYVLEAMWAGNRGRKQTPEEIAKRVAARGGKPPRPAGWKHSAEAKAKMGEASRKRGSAAIALAARWGRRCP